MKQRQRYRPSNFSNTLNIYRTMISNQSRSIQKRNAKELSSLNSLSLSNNENSIIQSARNYNRGKYSKMSERAENKEIKMNWQSKSINKSKRIAEKSLFQQYNNQVSPDNVTKHLLNISHYKSYSLSDKYKLSKVQSDQGSSPSNFSSLQSIDQYDFILKVNYNEGKNVFERKKL